MNLLEFENQSKRKVRKIRSLVHRKLELYCNKEAFENDFINNGQPLTYRQKLYTQIQHHLRSIDNSKLRKFRNELDINVKSEALPHVSLATTRRLFRDTEKQLKETNIPRLLVLHGFRSATACYTNPDLVTETGRVIGYRRHPSTALTTGNHVDYAMNFAKLERTRSYLYPDVNKLSESSKRSSSDSAARFELVKTASSSSSSSSIHSERKEEEECDQEGSDSDGATLTINSTSRRDESKSSASNQSARSAKSSSRTDKSKSSSKHSKSDKSEKSESPSHSESARKSLTSREGSRRMSYASSSTQNSEKLAEKTSRKAINLAVEDVKHEHQSLSERLLSTSANQEKDDQLEKSKSESSSEKQNQHETKSDKEKDKTESESKSSKTASKHSEKSEQESDDEDDETLNDVRNTLLPEASVSNLSEKNEEDTDSKQKIKHKSSTSTSSEATSISSDKKKSKKLKSLSKSSEDSSKSSANSKSSAQQTSKSTSDKEDNKNIGSAEDQKNDQTEDTIVEKNMEYQFLKPPMYPDQKSTSVESKTLTSEDKTAASTTDVVSTTSTDSSMKRAYQKEYSKDDPASEEKIDEEKLKLQIEVESKCHDDNELVDDQHTAKKDEETSIKKEKSSSEVESLSSSEASSSVNDLKNKKSSEKDKINSFKLEESSETTTSSESTTETREENLKEQEELKTQKLPRMASVGETLHVYPAMPKHTDPESSDENPPEINAKESEETYSRKNNTEIVEYKTENLPRMASVGGTLCVYPAMPKKISK